MIMMILIASVIIALPASGLSVGLISIIWGTCGFFCGLNLLKESNKLQQRGIAIKLVNKILIWFGLIGSILFIIAGLTLITLFMLMPVGW